MDIKTHRSAVVLVPPREVWGPIQEIRRLHDRHHGRWMPHVTLIYPFRPEETFDAVVPHFARACRRVSPFEMTLARFELFEHQGGSATLWLAPEPRKAVVRIHERLANVVPDCDDVRHFAHGYTPHLSVGQAPVAEARRLRRELQAAWVPLTFPVRRVQLIARPADGPFEVLRSIPLSRRRR